MRIAMLGSSHPVTDARITYKQAVSLAGAGHDVIVFGIKPPKSAVVPGVELHPLRDPGGGLPARARVIPKLISAAVDWRPDVVTCHEPESAVAGLVVRAKTGARVLFDVHELFHETLSSRMPATIRSFIRMASIALLRFLARRVDWITVVSPANRDFYRPFQRQGRVDIIHNSPMPEAFDLCNQDVSGPVIVCHEGHLNRGRGMVQMLNALVMVRQKVDVRLLLLGKVVPVDQSLYEQTVSKLGVAEQIEGPVWIDYTKLGATVARAQIGIVAMLPTPNNYLSLSNKLYNYMACGQPVIVPAGSASADLVRKYDAGIAVDTTSPEEIAQAVCTLAKDVELRKRLGANGRKAIEQELGWHKMEQRLAQIYDQLSRDPPAKAKVTQRNRS